MQQNHAHVDGILFLVCDQPYLHSELLKELIALQKEKDLPIAIRKLFTEVVKLGGTISGEHGIGLVQKDYMDIAFPEVALDLMRSIKTVFDPKGILNPGKIFAEN